MIDFTFLVSHPYGCFSGVRGPVVIGEQYDIDKFRGE